MRLRGRARNPGRHRRLATRCGIPHTVVQTHPVRNVLDLARMQRIRLSARPLSQRVVGHVFLGPNYRWWPGVDISIEHAERIPSGPVVYAMNHTDRYNYFPWQWKLWRAHDRMTATWVKGKYYEQLLVGAFMEMTNNIPAVSRGYVIARDVLSLTGAKPADDVYAALRRAADDWAVAGATTQDARPEAYAPAVAPPGLLDRPRDILGYRFDPAREHWLEAIDAVYRAMTRRFVELNAEALALGLDIIVFPEGTRSRRLSRGHVGLAQIALALNVPIVPVGCSGSDEVYPGGSPWGRAGRIVYRVGEPLTVEELSAWRPAEPFEPMTPEALLAHRDAFQGLVDEVMQRIDGLVDEPYRFVDGESDGVRGADRFL